MLSMLLMLTLNPVTQAAPRTAQVEPCIWPNKCAQETATVVQVEPCVWPRTCNEPAAPLKIKS